MDQEKIEKTAFICSLESSGYGYAIQYKEAYKLLYKTKTIDSIAIPILFLIRHYLELILKANIKYFAKYSESNSMIKEIDNKHDLLPLSNSFKEHWTKVKKTYNLNINDTEYFNKLDELIKKFNELDKKSFSFRYPCDKEGNPNLDATKPIDIYGIKKLVDEILPLLEYSIVEFEEMITPYNEYIKELSADIEREIMSYYF